MADPREVVPAVLRGGQSIPALTRRYGVSETTPWRIQDLSQLLLLARLPDVVDKKDPLSAFDERKARSSAPVP